MSYIAASKTGDQVFVWERHSPERVDLVTYPAPYYFYVKHSKGEYESMYGDKLMRFDFDNGKEFNRVRQDMISEGVEMFESDIPPELKVLSEHYYDVPAPSLNVTFLDIEVDYSKEIGFSTIDNPYAPINAIAMYHKWLNKYVIFAVPPNDATCEVPKVGKADQKFRNAMDSISAIDPECDLDIEFFANERDLLVRMLKEFENSDILCGWNSDFFDMPYIAKRLEKMGKRYLNKLSFDRARSPSFREIEKYGQQMWMVDIFGRQRLDYLELFRKYEVAERPSYKLESIADEVLPDLPKLKYTGTLADLFRDDFNLFIRYNIRDTEILKGFEDRLGYVELANQMVHLSTGEFKHVGGTLKLAELATINYCHHKLGGVIVNDLNVPDIDGRIEGALVLIPQVGQHKYIGSVDINSLYPSAIRAINISPETIIGQFTRKVEDAKAIAAGTMVDITLEYEDGETEVHTAQEWRDILKENKWTISGYATVFNQTKQGTIPKILEDWYAQRKIYQGKMREAITADDDDKAAYYDRLQYVYKIKLNSFYGALTNKYFRFYDLRMGESTTGTGRAILEHQCCKVAEIIDGVYTAPDRKVIDPDTGVEFRGYSDKWSVIYGDTDSTYFATGAESNEEAVMFADAIGAAVDASFPEFMRETFMCTDGYDQYIKTGREIVSDNGIFVSKKRYILHIIDNEGTPCDKMKVMGLDTKKTTMPKEVAKRINDYIKRLLMGEEWDTIANDICDYKDQLRNDPDVTAVGLPKGIKGIEDYTKKLGVFGDAQRLPGHVAAGILYNQTREAKGDHESLLIVSGMKIKVFYLKQKRGRFKSVALPVDIEEVPRWWMDEFGNNGIDYDAHIERLVDNPLQNIITAVGLAAPTRQGLLTDMLLEY